MVDEKNQEASKASDFIDVCYDFKQRLEEEMLLVLPEMEIYLSRVLSALNTFYDKSSAAKPVKKKDKKSAFDEIMSSLSFLGDSTEVADHSKTKPVTKDFLDECLDFKQKLEEELVIIHPEFAGNLFAVKAALNKFTDNWKKKNPVKNSDEDSGISSLMSSLSNLDFDRNSTGTSVHSQSNLKVNSLGDLSISSSSKHSTSESEEEKKEARKFVLEPRDESQLNKDLKKLLLFSNLERFSQMMQRNDHQLLFIQYQRIINELKSALQVAGMQINVFPCGSQMLGISDDHSDLDLFIDTGTFFKKLERQELEELVPMIQKILKKNPNFSDFMAVTRARTPILKVYAKREKVDLDLSFSNGLSYCNTTLLLYYFELQPVARQMVLFLKYWSKKCDFMMSGYLISLLVIFYFQVFQKLPSVCYLQRFSNDFLIDGWQADFVKIPGQHLNLVQEFDLKRLLHDFFKYYGHVFDYERYIVCPYLGKPVKKELFDQRNSGELVGQFDRYKRYMDCLDVKNADFVRDLFANRKPFVVQDPFEHIHNVSKNFTLQKTRKFKDFCRESWIIIKDQFKY